MDINRINFNLNMETKSFHIDEESIEERKKKLQTLRSLIEKEASTEEIVESLQGSGLLVGYINFLQYELLDTAIKSFWKGTMFGIVLLAIALFVINLF